MPREPKVTKMVSRIGRGYRPGRYKVTQGIDPEPDPNGNRAQRRAARKRGRSDGGDAPGSVTSAENGTPGG